MHTTQHLDDEHMRLYEWSGAGTGMRHALPIGSKRGHPWHASYGVLAVLTSLLILYGCDGNRPAGQASSPAVQGVKDGTGKLGDDTAPPSDPDN